MKIAAVAACLLLCGCVFSLGHVQPQTGKNADQQQLDTLTCKDQAHLAASTAGRQTGAFLLGLTVVGTPVAMKLDRNKQRGVFQECMAGKGYTVTKDW